MRKFTGLIILLGILLSIASCGRKSSVPSARGRHVTFKEQKSSFRAKKNRKSKPGQMGFYRKKDRTPVFTSISRSVRWTFANKKKRHSIGNERRPASVHNQKQRQKRSLSRANASFVKGKQRAKRSKFRKRDHSKDSFSKNPNKKGKK